MDFYFTSVNNDEYIDYLRNNNCCNVLVSFLEKSKILGLIDKNIKDMKIFVDSGAFSAFTRNIKIDIDTYIKFLNDNHKNLTLYASLDVIPDWNSLESIKSSCLKSWENFLYMKSKLIDSNKLVPTFHFGDDFNMLYKYLNFTDNNGTIKYLALGGLARANILDRYEFIKKCYKIISECNRCDIKIHLFGVTDMDICDEFGASSVDSTTWVRAASFGEICTDNGRFIVSENRLMDDKHIFNKYAQHREFLTNLFKQEGFELEDLMKSSKSREFYNIKDLELEQLSQV